ncbi:hypothetical protein GCM10027425_27050 [Alteromonas gracilis]
MRVLSLVTLVVVLSSACGAAGSGGSDDGTASAEQPAAPSSSAPADELVPDPTLPPGKGEATHTGTIAEGVEAGCVLLEIGSGGPLLLVGPGVEAYAAGDRVTVRGTPQPDMMTTCQQGAPFAVTSVSPAG